MAFVDDDKLRFRLVRGPFNRFRRQAAAARRLT
jgi:hypothetical protein